MARSGMADMISQFRLDAGVPTSSLVSGIEYWSDDHIQDLLDKNGMDFELYLNPNPYLVNGATVYTDYYFPVTYRFIETDFVVRDMRGYDQVGNFTYYAHRLLVQFASNQNGVSFTARGRVYDYYRSVADAWRQKLVLLQGASDIRSGNHWIFQSQEWANANKMIELYSSKSGIKVVRMQSQGYRGYHG